MRLYAYRAGRVAFWLLFALAACAPTPHAVLRREGESRLRGCMTGTRCAQTRACLAESSAWCRAQGLEASCGADGLFIDVVSCPP